MIALHSLTTISLPHIIERRIYIRKEEWLVSSIMDEILLVPKPACHVPENDFPLSGTSTRTRNTPSSFSEHMTHTSVICAPFEYPSSISSLFSSLPHHLSSSSKKFTVSRYVPSPPPHPSGPSHDRADRVFQSPSVLLEDEGVKQTPEFDEAYSPRPPMSFKEIHGISGTFPLLHRAIS